MSVLTCKWKKLAFANYIFPAEILEKYLPEHTKLDYYNGKCFVSLVGFQFQNVKIAGVKIPFHTNFEEINLRFYVKRFDGASWRKGTVFISEIADKAALNILANSIFHENYQTLPTKQEIEENKEFLKAKYSWQFNEEWQHLEVISKTLATPYAENSEAEFILDRPFGYGKQSEEETNEYKIYHRDWPIYEVQEYSIKVDFTKVFGPEFNILNSATPHSVILAEGSSVSAEKRVILE
jgi:uncharacterized protein YqjF (DUF2071 family)